MYIVFSTSAAYENYVSVSGISDSDDADSVQQAILDSLQDFKYVCLYCCY